jgi:hypothetical protein
VYRQTSARRKPGPLDGFDADILLAFDEVTFPMNARPEPRLRERPISLSICFTHSGHGML